VMLTTHPLLVPRLRKSWAIPPLILWVLQSMWRGSPLLCLCINSAAYLRFHCERCLEKSSIKIAFW